MTRSELISRIRKTSSFLCVGLDTDKDKIPRHLLAGDDPVFEFNRAIIDATADHCVAFKPNLAFYERHGPRGLESLKKTMEYIPKGIFTIADAKRGDIGNTSQMYADTFFNYYGFDAITVSPYMGKDSVDPFLNHPDKWTVLLALTSNPGSVDFQLQRLDSGEYLFENTIRVSSQWATPERTMYVVGATRSEYLSKVRSLIPEHFLLIPGIGAQGGDLDQVARLAMTGDGGILVNASRSILYASGGKDFASKAKAEAGILQEKMKKLLDNFS